ncbi:MAG: type I-E CRISPR-associated endoribonuclease Cas2 [Syntrophomonadaceae bacterium]|jgi:CRISPR-associated protein Cas2|nr:type I-E CRISPR-associated endoribonuclease Cas2 [Syntrophomonadaceae bacterium]
MIVITMTDCPVGLRGDLTKWLLEVNTGVFVGQVSARVRDNLWERIKETAKDGRVTMVFSTNNEQKLDFRIHNSTWEPIDFDGIKLILRPSPSRIKQLGELRLGFSKASKRQIAKRAEKKRGANTPDDYVVIDIETSGLNPEEHEIIELGAILVEAHKIKERFSVLVQPQKDIAEQIENITGITNAMLREEGVDISIAMQRFIAFMDGLPVVAHNADFDYSFLRKACALCNLPLFSNRSICTLILSRRKIRKVDNYKLITLAKHFGIPTTKMHRSLADCEITYQLYEKLINLDTSGL